MTDSTRQHGGARPGAGRKRTAGQGGALRSALGVALPPDLIQLLAERSAREGCSRSEALARCLREWAARRDEGRQADA